MEMKITACVEVGAAVADRHRHHTDGEEQKCKNDDNFIISIRIKVISLHLVEQMNERFGKRSARSEMKSQKNVRNNVDRCTARRQPPIQMLRFSSI